jgi:hypothetical protein
MDRKALIREYKQRRPPMGVYRVHSTATGRSLVAAATDLPSILNRHRFQLQTGGHPTRALQADWKEHGAESFVFEVLDTLPERDQADYDPVPDLAVLEDMWLERLSLVADRIHTIDPKRLGPGSRGR